MKIVHFADLHLGVERYGRIDPASGLSSRLMDFLVALDQVVDYALENKVDLVLFCGDAYKTREPSQTQQREFARRISRLSTGGVPVFLLVGNHDLPNAIGRATTTEIFDTLAVKSVYVSSKPDVYRIETPGGIIQVASLPWLRRGALLTRDDVRNLDFEQIKQKMQQILTGVITSHLARLDPSLPTILAAHVWVTGAAVGSEKLMTIGSEPGLLLSNVAQPAFDYVALGHIHRRQVLSESPPVVYAGSLERLDFGEEADEKGFYVVDIAPDAAGGRRQVSFEFHAVSGRSFLTIEIEIEADEADPTAAVLGAVAAKGDAVRDAIVRLNISLPVQLEGQLRDADIHNALKEAYYLIIARNVRREARLRLGNWAAEEITPVNALKAYLESRNVPAERAEVLLEYGQKLMLESEGGQGS